jgi:putative heme-binding domain-containing protein
MAKTGSGHMPHLAAELVDERGLALVHEWIRSLSPSAVDNSPLSALRSIDKGATNENDPAGKRASAINELLSSTSAALALSRAVGEKQLSPELRERIVAAGASHGDAAVRDLFERFLADERRAGRLGHRFKPQAVLSLQGDAERGKALFMGTSTMQCKTCHRVKDEGGRVGPDLSAIGKKLSREQILESLAEPSKTIAQEYRTQLVQTSVGRTFTGVIVAKTASEMVIRDAQDKETRLKIDEIELTTAQPQSMMPDGLLRDLTPQQAADLLDYMSSLR